MLKIKKKVTGKKLSAKDVCNFVGMVESFDFGKEDRVEQVLERLAAREAVLQK